MSSASAIWPNMKAPARVYRLGVEADLADVIRRLPRSPRTGTLPPGRWDERAPASAGRGAHWRQPLLTCTQLEDREAVRAMVRELGRFFPHGSNQLRHCDLCLESQPVGVPLSHWTCGSWALLYAPGRALT